MRGPENVASESLEAAAHVWATLPTVLDTHRLAHKVAQVLVPGDWISLMGPLGAGKTQFVVGLAEALRCRPLPSSPSFVLVQHYAGRIPLLHADLFRLESPDEYWDLALEELAEDFKAAVAVEWADRFPGALPEDLLWIALDFSNGGRSAKLWATGPRGRRLLEGAKKISNQLSPLRGE